MESRIAICTTTFYPTWQPGEADLEVLLATGNRVLAENKIRGDLALETAQAVLRKGYRLVLVDGAQGSAFQEELTRRGIPFLQEAAHGMSASRRQSFDAAFADPSIQSVAWIEPEKVGMVDEVETCSVPILSGEAAMIIPSRTEQGWNSLPSYQRISEEEGNRIFNEKLRLAGLFVPSNLDVYFGPRILSATAAYRAQLQDILHRQYTFKKRADIPFHAVVNPGAYAEATFFPPIAALDVGLPVKGVATNFCYPEQQQLLEEHPPFAEGPSGYRTKRKAQLAGILTELVHYLKSIGRLKGSSRLEKIE